MYQSTIINFSNIALIIKSTEFNQLKMLVWSNLCCFHDHDVIQ